MGASPRPSKLGLPRSICGKDEANGCAGSRWGCCVSARCGMLRVEAVGWLLERTSKTRDLSLSGNWKIDGLSPAHYAHIVWCSSHPRFKGCGEIQRFAHHREKSSLYDRRGWYHLCGCRATAAASGPPGSFWLSPLRRCTWWCPKLPCPRRA